MFASLPGKWRFTAKSRMQWEKLKEDDTESLYTEECQSNYRDAQGMTCARVKLAEPYRR